MIDHAIEALKRGEFILLYDFDDREGETDLAIRSDSITPRHILRMRKDAGGLICTAIHPRSAKKLGLPFASDVLEGTLLAEMADITPAVTVCEMLDDTTGNALSKDDAMAYAKDHNLVFIEGREILETWRKSQGSLAFANSSRAISV